MEIQENYTDFSKLMQNLASVGFLILDKRLNVMFWNRFLELHSQTKSDAIVNKKITEFFPEINESWLSKKIKTTFVLNSQGSTSWEQRPYLLKFPSTHSSIDGVDFMYQNCSYFPVKSIKNVTVGVGIIIHDVTDSAYTQKLLESVTDQAMNLEEVNARDFLTGLYNRQFFFEQLSQDATRCRKLGWGLELAMIDVDFFKKVNDTYGHQVGDEVLKEIAVRLQSTLRTSDSLCRYGGEEFVLILPYMDPPHSRNVCDRIRQCIDGTPIELNGLKLEMSVSIGVSNLRDDISLQDLIAEADGALYLAKRNGRNRVEWH